MAYRELEAKEEPPPEWVRLALLGVLSSIAGCLVWSLVAPLGLGGSPPAALLRFLGTVPTPFWSVPVLAGNLVWAWRRCPYLTQIEAHRLGARGGET